MRTLGNIFIILFVAVSMYIVKDDVIRFFRSIPDQLTILENKAEDFIKPTDVETATVAPTAPQTPGPLEMVKSLAGMGMLSQSGVIAETNKARKVNGDLPPFTENAKLDESAKIKLDDMFTKQYFEHVSPSNVSISDLGNTVGYEYVIIGENLALGGFGSDAELVTAWMNSPGHRANILNTRYTEIGVAIGKGRYQGRTVWLAVQHFGLPRKACPAIDQILKATIQGVETNLKILATTLTALKKDLATGNYSGDTYTQKTNEYNSLVEKYNAQVSDVKKQITTYNAEVQSFNLCAQGN